MLPEMKRIPGVGRLVPRKRHATLNVMAGLYRPTTGRKLARGRGKALVLGGDGTPRGNLTLNQLEQWKVALRQVRHLDGPIVHLNVDVSVIVAVPSGGVGIVPEPLEVGRKPAGA